MHGVEQEVDVGKDCDTAKEKNPVADRNSAQTEANVSPAQDAVSQPLISGAERKPEDAGEDLSVDQIMMSVKYVLMCCILLVLYVVIWTVIFYFVERDQGWTWVDAWFFSVVTLTTVGYGILTPSDTMGQVLVIVFLALGIVFATFTLGLATDMFLASFQRSATNITKGERLCFGLISPKVAATLFVLFLLFLLGVLYGVMWEKWNFWGALYFTIVTISTTGYGDMSPTTPESRLVMSLYVLIGVAMFTTMISAAVARLIAGRRHQASVDLMVKLLDPARLPLIDQEGHGTVNAKEFTEYFLIKMGLVKPKVLEMINGCFTDLDTDQSGVIDVVKLVSAEEGLNLLEQAQAQLNDKYLPDKTVSDKIKNVAQTSRWPDEPHDRA